MTRPTIRGRWVVWAFLALLLAGAAAIAIVASIKPDGS